MTKAELLSEVQGKSWFLGLIGSLEIEQEWPTMNAKMYRGHVMAEKETNVLSLHHIYFYTIDEGEPEEAAYYKDSSVDDQIGYESP